MNFFYKAQTYQLFILFLPQNAKVGEFHISDLRTSGMSRLTVLYCVCLAIYILCHPVVSQSTDANRTGLAESHFTTLAPNATATNATVANSSVQMPETLANGSSASRVVVKVGHIGATGALPNDHKILNISRMQLWEEGVLGSDLDFDIVTQMGCGDSFEGAAVAAQLYHKEGIRAFIGPYCNTELDAVAKMSSFWNIPVISYMPTASALGDRTIYKTLSRISSKNTNSIAKAVAKLLEHYGWRRVAVVTNTGPIAYERTQAFEEEFRKIATGVTVVKKIMFEENWDAAEMVRSGLLSEIAQSARIVICIFSNTRDLTREFMQATSNQNMNNAEYAYILPWLQSGLKDASPWSGSSGEMLQQVKDHYANAIIVDDVNGFDDSIIKGFLARIEKFGLTQEDIDVTNIFGYLHLYDSLKLYALAARKAFNAAGGAASSVVNGHQIWTNMRGMTFDGIGSTIGGLTGNVIMDDLGDRAALFAAFFVAPNRDRILKMVNMEPFRLNNCEGLTNRTGCYDLKLTDLMTGFWPSENGSMPLDEPVCGFRGQKCSYTIEIGVGVTVLIIFFVIVISFFLYRHCQTRALNKMPWRIFHEDLRLIDEEQAKSLV
ncbi:receptor family ligand binding region domain-containing protein [Ditylenchus destructor]|uniref:Receptor family ligand binding region domain-containing protein n=1 Tax=Ditylenchus destructor TaxID=166010 RepID=A0AAD4R2H2_9BILA|nr:receptor family ligand binding region domain-containing protein [Ditylenchus destructor]